MSDQQSPGSNSGLEELVQRIKAISDPAPEGRNASRGTAPPFGSVANGNTPRYEAYEDVRLSAPLPPPDTFLRSSFDSPYKRSEPSQVRSASSPISQGSPDLAESFSEYPAQSYGPAVGQIRTTPPANGKNPGLSPGADLPFASTAAYGTASPSGFGPGYTPEFGRSLRDSLKPETSASSSQAAQPATSGTLQSNPETAADDADAPKSGLQRAINAVRAALPLVQKLLPLLDGNFATAINALVAPHVSNQGSHHAPPQTLKVNLEPVERALNEVRNSHRELRTQVLDQVNTFKRVEDQLERVREATDRNTLEQQELVEDLRAVGNRVSTFAIIGLILLIVSVGINVFFLVQLQHLVR